MGTPSSFFGVNLIHSSSIASLPLLLPRLPLRVTLHWSVQCPRGSKCTRNLVRVDTFKFLNRLRKRIGHILTHRHPESVAKFDRQPVPHWLDVLRRVVVVHVERFLP